VEYLVLAPAINVEAQLEGTRAVAEALDLDGSSGGPAHGRAPLSFVAL
jgi:hypothetical protein